MLTEYGSMTNTEMVIRKVITINTFDISLIKKEKIVTSLNQVTMYYLISIIQ